MMPLRMGAHGATTSCRLSPMVAGWRSRYPKPAGHRRRAYAQAKAALTSLTVSLSLPVKCHIHPCISAKKTRDEPAVFGELFPVCWLGAGPSVPRSRTPRTAQRDILLCMPSVVIAMLEEPEPGTILYTYWLKKQQTSGPKQKHSTPKLKKAKTWP